MLRSRKWKEGLECHSFGPIKRIDRDETVLLTLITFSSSVVTVICGGFRMRKEDDDLDSMVLATLRHSDRDTHTFALTLHFLHKIGGSRGGPSWT